MVTNSAHYNQNYYQSRGISRILSDQNYYDLLADYWKEAIFIQNNLDPNLPVLDYGCGLGQVSASLPQATLFDPSRFATDFLQQKGRDVVVSIEDIPKNNFDFLLSSHSLEHSPKPSDDLRRFHNYLKPNGQLILILPIETDLKPSIEPDLNQHFQCWTFQTITNLLIYCGWQPTHQSILYNPFLLRTLGKKLSPKQAVKASRHLGSLKKSYPSMLIIAKSAS